MSSAVQKYARTTYVASGFLLVAGIYLQVYLAMRAITVEFGHWAPHLMMGSLLGLPVLIMLLSLMPAGLPRKVKVLTFVTFGLYLLQYALISLPAQLGVQGLSALHGVGALALYTVAHKVTIDAFRLVRGG